MFANTLSLCKKKGTQRHLNACAIDLRHSAREKRQQAADVEEVLASIANR
jgi:hypothetical protein